MDWGKDFLAGFLENQEKATRGFPCTSCSNAATSCSLGFFGFFDRSANSMQKPIFRLGIFSSSDSWSCFVVPATKPALTPSTPSFSAFFATPGPRTSYFNLLQVGDWDR